MFGVTPAQGFYLRHVKNIDMSHIEITSIAPDARPGFVLDDVQGADFLRVKTEKEAGVPTFSLRDVQDFNCALSRGVPDTTLAHVQDKTI